ncbi:MAG TPA: MotA/TolQ/ExbB proton channel family protein, partial [Burkholderiales bacterium]|nr:MotA/TolQ/ExbB proton channel family protein [Burkholderiales bacterium]
MNAQPAVGFAHFLAQTDGVGTTLLFLLLVMSVATWYLIATRAWMTVLERRRTAHFLASFWDAPSLQAVAAHLERQPADEPFSNLTQQAIVAARHHQRHGANKLNESGSTAEF